MTVRRRNLFCAIMRVCERVRPGGDRKPLQVTGIETAGLRRTDRELLRGGITVGSQEQLLLLLEDLGS